MDIAVDVAADADPAGAVLAAHRAGRRISLATSGSAGRPRQVFRTTASWVDSFPVVARLTGLDGSSRVWLPGRVAGPGDPTGRVGHGSTLALFAEVLARHTGAACVSRPEDATHAHLTPGQLERALDPLAVARAAGPVHVTVAGEALPGPLRERAGTAGIRVSGYYGAAELSFVAWAVDGTSLRPFPGVEVDVRDGEIWARSPYLCDGYVDAEAGGALRTDADGFATVGDRGRWEPEGAAEDARVLVVTGRGDDAVTTGAATVLVADVEAVLRPVVRGGVAVVGVPHDALGHVLAAVLTDPADLEAAHAAGQELAAAQRPRLWFHRDELPLAVSGKSDRSALRAEVAALRTPGGGGTPLRRLVPGRTR